MEVFTDIDYGDYKIDTIKASILEATIASLAEDGLGGVTFESVGKRCKMSPAHVRYHFKDKSELIKLAVVYAIKRPRKDYAESVSATFDPKEKIIALLDANFTWFRKNPTYRICDTLFTYLASTDEELSRLYREHEHSGRQKYTDIIGPSLHQLGYTKSEILQIASDLRNLSTGYVEEYLCTFPAAAGPDVRKRAINGIKRFLDALFVKI